MRLAGLLVLAVVAPTSALASPDAKGFKLGTNLFQVEKKDSVSTSEGSSSTNGQPGVTFGASITWRYATAFAVQQELLVSRKHLTTERCSPCVDINKIDLWYIELPFFLRLDLLPGERGKFHLDAGPEFVIALGGGATDAMTGAYQAFDQGVRDGDNLPPVNLGVVFGAGLEFGAGTGRITIDFRYKRWFIPVLPTDMPDSDLKSTHQLVALIGYAFP